MRMTVIIFLPLLWWLFPENTQSVDYNYLYSGTHNYQSQHTMPSSSNRFPIHVMY